MKILVITAVLLFISPTSMANHRNNASVSKAEQETADAWADLGQWNKAVKHYKIALSATPDSKQIQLKLARGLYRLGQKNKALNQLRQLSKHHPNWAAVSKLTAQVYLDSDDAQKACHWFGRALKAKPQDGSSVFGSGKCHHVLFVSTHQLKDKKVAIEYYNKYLELFPAGAKAILAKEGLDKLSLGALGKHLVEAKDALAKGRYRMAAKTLRAILNKKPDLQRAHFLLGMAMASPVMDDVNGAIEQWHKAPDDKNARLQLGLVAYEDDEPVDALEHLEKAVKIDPKFAQAWYQIALVHLQEVDDQDSSGNLSNAKDALNKVIALAPGTALAQTASSKLELLSGKLNFLSESEVIDTSSEIELGRKITQGIEQQFGLVHDEKIQTRLDRILRRISKHSERLAGALPYKIKVLDIDGINALSFSGGVIYVYRGLLDFIRIEMKDSDDALATIIAHEVVHVDRRHSLGMLNLVGGAKQMLTGRTFNVRSLQTLMKGISRRQEFEADQIGALYAYRAGFDPAAEYRFHRKMLATGHEVPPGMDHPSHEERAAKLKEYLIGLRIKARHFKRGLQALDQDRYEDAVRHFEIFLGLFPKSLSGRNNLAVALHSLALKRRVGENRFKLSTDIDPNVKIPKIRLRSKTGAFSMDRALMEEAAAQFKTLVEINPAYTRARLNLGSCLLSLGDTKAAVGQFEYLIRTGDHSPQVQNNLAVAKIISKEKKKGIELLQKLIKEHPDFADSYFNLAAEYTEQGKDKQAIRMFKEYLSKNSHSGWANQARKEIARLTGDSR